MVRTLAIAIAVLSVGIVSARADVVRGKVKSTDADKNTITITADGKDQTITVAKNATITQPATGKKAKKLPPVTVTLGALTTGADVAVTTERKDDADVATKIEVQAAAKKKKKNQ